MSAAPKAQGHRADSTGRRDPAGGFCGSCGTDAFTLSAYTCLGCGRAIPASQRRGPTPRGQTHDHPACEAARQAHAAYLDRVGLDPCMLTGRVRPRHTVRDGYGDRGVRYDVLTRPVLADWRGRSERTDPYWLEGHATLGWAVFRRPEGVPPEDVEYVGFIPGEDDMGRGQVFEAVRMCRAFELDAGRCARCGRRPASSACTGTHSDWHDQVPLEAP